MTSHLAAQTGWIEQKYQLFCFYLNDLTELQHLLSNSLLYIMGMVDMVS